MEKQGKKKFDQKITMSLFEAWKSSTRYGDAKSICEVTGWSYPVVQRALKYGYANSDKLINDISNFFVKRTMSEKEAAASI